MDIVSEIGRITNILEDAFEERDWSEVQNMIEALDTLYQELDKRDSAFDYDYEQ
tara:strand:- start:40 stop:201 length:162 start_codon:yes stop_codon:yes gene_type:complete